MASALKNGTRIIPTTRSFTTQCAAAPMGFKPYLLREKSVPVAELFLNSYELLATKGSIQLRRIESIGAFVPGSNPLWKGGRGACPVLDTGSSRRSLPHIPIRGWDGGTPCHQPLARTPTPPLPFSHVRRQGRSPTGHHGGALPRKSRFQRREADSFSFSSMTNPLSRDRSLRYNLEFWVESRSKSVGGTRLGRKVRERAKRGLMDRLP